MSLLLIDVHEKESQKVQTDGILTARARYLEFALVLKLCTRGR